MNHNYVCQPGFEWSWGFFSLCLSVPPASLTSDPKNLCVCLCVFGSAHVHLILHTWRLVRFPRLASSCRAWQSEECCSCVHRQQLLGQRNKNRRGSRAVGERKTEKMKYAREKISPLRYQCFNLLVENKDEGLSASFTPLCKPRIKLNIPDDKFASTRRGFEFSVMCRFHWISLKWKAETSAKNMKRNKWICRGHSVSVSI